MVDKKTAARVAGGSAIVIGAITYGVAMQTSDNIVLAIIVAASVFAIGYFGMVQK